MVTEPGDGSPDETRPMKALTPGSQISHYKIIEKIGRGGMGVVYRAEDTKLKRTVALKFLPSYLTEDPHAKERFVLEAQAASALDHHNICTVHEIDETDDGRTFIAMACYKGETLKERIERGPLDLDEALELASQITDGLTEAHRKGIVHRDLKPANIMITGDGVVKIMDFGLAKLAGRTRITRTDTTMGTPAYMSPEQARGQEVDPRSDIFSVGVILYEMIASRPPFRGDHEAAVLHSILHDEPEPLSLSRPATPQQLQRIVSRALAKKAESRYRDTSELSTDLSSLRETTRVGVSGRPRRVVGRGKFLIPAVVVLGLVVAYLAISHYFPSGDIGSILSGRSSEDRHLASVAPKKPFTIVVTRFWGVTDEAAEEGKVMQALIERQLRAELGGEADVRILSEVVSRVPRSQADAIALGKEFDAELVIWGEVFSLHGEVEIQPYLTQVSYDWLPLDPSTPALETDLSQSSQLAMRRAKAEEVGNMGLVAAAFYYSRVDSDKALAVLRRATPRSTMSIVTEAWVEFFRDRRAEAERLCIEAAALDALDPWPPYTLGAMYSELGRYDEAVSELERAFALAPDHEEIRWQLALALARTGDQRALGLYREALDHEPESSKTHGRVGFLYYSLDRLEDAIHEYELAIRLEPEDHWQYFRLGLAYEAADSLSRAVAILEQGKDIAKSKQDRATLGWYLGRAYYHQGRHEAAINEFHEAIALRPGYPNAYFLLMSSYTRLGRGVEGLAVIQKAVEAYPEEGLLHQILGSAYRSLGRPADAVAACRDAVRLNPNNGDAYFGLGQSYAELDSLDLAASCYRAAGRLGVRYIGHAAPHFRLASVHLVQGHHEDAMKEASRAIEIDPDQGDARALLAALLVHQGKYDQAVRESMKASELHPDFLYFHLFYALSLHHSDRGEEGRAHLRRIAESFAGDPWEESLIGFLTGGLDEATFLSLAESEDPRIDREHRCETYYYIGMAYLLSTDADLESSRPDTTMGRTYLERCLETGVRHYLEYSFAQLELSRLQNR